MADKLQQGVNVLTTFVEGETPTAAKLNSITAQLKNASQQLERAVGDIHGQSYPYSSATNARLSIAYGRDGSGALTNAETRALDIVNLARLIGPASALNPMILGNDIEVTEPVPSDVTEFSLRYPPETPGAASFTKNASGEAFETLSDVVDLSAAGEYHVDSLGRVYITQATDSVDPGTVTYTINRSSWFGGPNYEGGRFNVIPDPNQLSSGGSGLSFSAPDTQGRRTVTTPTITHAQYNVDMDSVSLDEADPNYLKTLVLPQVITTEYAVGELIPEGFVLLKNWTTGEVYDTAEYIYNSETSLLIGAVDITTEVDRGDVFCLITVGTDITTAIDDLRRKSRHAHDRTFGEPLVPAASVSGWTAGPWGGRGSFVASTIEGNYAPQYLHRYGYESGENNWNDENIMRGSLVLGKSGATPGGYLDSSGVSYSIYFGSVADGPRMYNSAQSLYVTSDSGIWMDADGSARLSAAGGDLTIRSMGGDVVVGGGLELQYYTGDPYVTDAIVNNVGLRVAPLAGNVSVTAAGAAVDSVVAGPHQDGSSYYNGYALDIWAIDENGARGGDTSDGTGSNHYATTTTTGSHDSSGTSNGWVVPAVQIIHYAQWNKTFTPYDSVGAGSPIWSQVSFWQTNIKLPEYLYNTFANNLGGNAVVGISVMVKSSDTNERWWTLGASGRYGNDNGERVQAYMDFSDTVSSDNEIQIMIGGDGNSNQNFHYSRFQGVDASGDPASTIAVDVKILLHVAGPTNSAGLIPAIRA